MTPGTRVRVITDVWLMDGDAKGRIGTVQTMPSDDTTVYDTAVLLDGNQTLSYFLADELEVAS